LDRWRFISHRFGSITIPQMMIKKMPLLLPCDILLRLPLPCNATSLNGGQEQNLEAEHGLCDVKSKEKPAASFERVNHLRP
jgi:hypothetical protein